MTENPTYCDKHVSSQKCIIFVVVYPMISSSRPRRYPDSSWLSGCLSRRIARGSTWQRCRVRDRSSLQKNTLPWWYVFVTVGHVFCHACTSMTNLWQNEDSHTCAIVEVFHDITKIIIAEVSTSMTINHASQKCFHQGWPTRGIHRNGSPLSYRVWFWIC